MRVRVYGPDERRKPLIDTRTQEPPTWLQLESVRPLSEAMVITNLDRRTLLRNYRHLCVRLSPRRWGIKLKHCLAIADGTASTAL
jgi:hypothetical protein